MTRLTALSTAAISIILAAGAFANQIIYVDTAASGSNDGSTWANAHVHLQDALAQAGSLPRPVEIHVAQGTYRPDRSAANPNGTGNRAATFQLINGISIKGGYAGFGQADPDARNVESYKTILSGDLAGDDGPDFTNYEENSLHVTTGVSTNNTAMIEGFTIVGGNADIPDTDGAGMNSYGGSPTVLNCTFVRNRASGGGGAIRYYASDPIIENCRFINNSANLGGAIWCGRCKQAPSNCTFISNWSNALHMDLDRGSEIINCIFMGNSGHSGVIWFYRSTPTLVNCVFAGNAGPIDAVYNREGDVTMVNCTVFANSNDGSSLHCLNNATTRLYNCILWRSAPTHQVISLYENSEAHIAYCSVPQTTWPPQVYFGPGNIQKDPFFADPEGPDGVIGTEDDDLRLLQGSPCIDAGDNSVIPASVITDYAGNARIIGDTVDIGAYEGIAYPVRYVRYVDGQNGNDENDGYTANTALATIQKGISTADDGNLVLVYPGLYSERVNFLGKAIRVKGLPGATGVPVLENPGDYAVSFYSGEGPDSILQNLVVRNSFMGVFIAGSAPTINNITVTDNMYGIAAYADSDPTINSCIVWNNAGGSLFGCVARYSCIEDNVEGLDNIHANPQFADPAAGDYRLRSQQGRCRPPQGTCAPDSTTSPCIDTGDPALDWSDEPRPNGGRINMGAYGGTAFASLSYPGPHICYVDDSASGLNNGSSWADAYEYLQDALTEAVNVEGPVEIRVAQGVYIPDRSKKKPNGTGSREASFALASDIRLYGGFPPGGGDSEDRDPDIYETVLTGDLAGNDAADIPLADLLNNWSRADNSYNVVTVGTTTEKAVLDGFTVTGGNANGFSGENRRGGGIRGDDGELQIDNCTVVGNAAADGGGGIYECFGSISNCTVSGNMAGGNGGGFYVCRKPISNCTISDNVAARYGGGLYGGSTPIRNCQIINNSAGAGGGLYLFRGPISNCTISGNRALSENNSFRGSGGGGLHNCDGSISNCIIRDNAAKGSGGGLRDCDGALSHCTITGNSAGDDGGGLDMCEGAISHCTISRNTAGAGGGGLSSCHGPLSYCVISQNKASANGGGIRYCYSSISDCTISGNTAGQDGGAIWLCDGPISLCTIAGNAVVGRGGTLVECGGAISNCIIWNNRHYGDSPLHQCSTPLFSCVQGGSAGNGCIDVDPAFATPGHWDPNGTAQDQTDDFWAEGDYHLHPDSPCIDAGNLFYAMHVPGTDADGNARLAGPQIDMGCFESGALADGDGDWLADISEPANADNPDRDNDGIFDGIELLRHTDPNASDPLTEWNVPGDVSSIQQALFFGRPGETIVIGEGVYYENLYIGGRNITLTGTDPNDAAVVAATVINGDTDRDPITTSGRVVTMLGTEDETCYVRGLTITGGSTNESGGGIHGHASDAGVGCCSIIGNTAGLDGGGIWGVKVISNCTVSGNKAVGNGGGIANSGPISNCTIVGNSAGYDGGGLAYCHKLTSSCIIWANRQAFGSQLFLYHNLVFSCVHDADGDVGCIDADPQFADPGHWDANDTPQDLADDSWVDGDYHLKSKGWRWDTQRERWTYDDTTSPCIDAGDPATPLGDELLTAPEDPNNIYGQNVRINMGVYGGTAQASIAPHDWAIHADYSNDGTVNSTDFACWSYALRPRTVISGDLDRNGIADPDDLTVLSEDWLKQTSWFDGPLPMDPLPDPPSGGTGR